jgi:hypothetical protein
MGNGTVTCYYCESSKGSRRTYKVTFGTVSDLSGYWYESDPGTGRPGSTFFFERTTMTIEAITPEKAMEMKVPPDAVIEIFNSLILRDLSDGTAIVSQDEVVSRIVDTTEFSRSEVFDNHLLDVEDFYRLAGWKVEYDRPAYNETYRPTWTFKVR